jgi:hypothetical protein
VLVIDDETRSVEGFREAQLDLWFAMWQAATGLRVK